MMSIDVALKADQSSFGVAARSRTDHSAYQNCDRTCVRCVFPVVESGSVEQTKRCFGEHSPRLIESTPEQTSCRSKLKRLVRTLDICVRVGHNLGFTEPCRLLALTG